MTLSKANLFVVGAAKSGTTTFYEYCALHPEISVPVAKEPHYFGDYTSPGCVPPGSDADYLRLFTDRDALAIRYLADFSPSYLYSARAAAQIKAYNPEARVIAFLRDPVERTLSMYFHQRKSLLEPLGLADALAAEPERIRAGWGYGFHYKTASLYHDQVSRYLDAFGERFQVYFFEDFIRRPETVLEQIAASLGLSRGFAPLGIHSNRTGEPRSLLIQKLISREYPGKDWLRKLLGKRLIDRLIALNVGAKPEVDPRIKRELAQYFAADIHKLETLLGRSTGWSAR